MNRLVLLFHSTDIVKVGNAVIHLYLSFIKYFTNIFKKKGVDGFVNGVGKAVNYGSRQIRLLQSGQVGIYVLMMVLGILLFFIIQLFL